MPSKQDTPTTRFWYTRTGGSNPHSFATKLVLLPQRQQERYHAIKSAPRKKQYLYSRLLICSALSQLYRQPTTSWDIEDSTQASPFIHNLSSTCHTSLSHSHDLICFALSTAQVGVDVELMKARRNFKQLAELFMSEDELQRLPKDKNEGNTYFYRLWCAKEALYKALPVQEQASTSLASISYHALLDQESPWQLNEYIVDDYRVAVVNESTAPPAKLIKIFLDLNQDTTFSIKPIPRTYPVQK
ncbi:4'-phosphopantetheinyl transferase superfamily protein [Marinobacterium sp. D7]|uniref:4'-phosphopantetheinyl transferase family protein n=1 Tax=Marinobacterium ramblicola TaxID=2849041 RepID=UPI001C2D17A9|nr:4'-phosphopantetheinyl transferase superfamily protein [Marinobacterium ramblicola]MBV1788297.1 4'-phosphopantetheinyl transferase superfamily protein [Marinobacterium ramblicola]